jgi:AraC family ethanolamine operon transcriptional activator
MQPWIEMECYQLGSGKQLAQMDILDLGAQQIVRESQSAAVQKLGVTPPDLCTLSYCTPEPSFRFSELGAGAVDTVFFMPEHTEFDIYVPAGVQTVYISFSQEEFLSGARVLNPEQWAHAPQELHSIQTTQQASLKAAVNLWLKETDVATTPDAPRDMDNMRTNLLHHVLQMATAAKPDDSRLSPTERVRALNTCRMARAFVEASLESDIVPTIVDICRTLGVSERTLQYAFRAYVDMSPLAYLRLRRLNRVRATLRASDPQTTTVTAVAMRFGFLHLGRFSLDYKQVFDERPSVTLAS